MPFNVYFNEMYFVISLNGFKIWYEININKTKVLFTGCGRHYKL